MHCKTTVASLAISVSFLSICTYSGASDGQLKQNLPQPENPGKGRRGAHSVATLDKCHPLRLVVMHVLHCLARVVLMVYVGDLAMCFMIVWCTFQIHCFDFIPGNFCIRELYISYLVKCKTAYLTNSFTLMSFIQGQLS